MLHDDRKVDSVSLQRRVQADIRRGEKVKHDLQAIIIALQECSDLASNDAEAIARLEGSALELAETLSNAINISNGIALAAIDLADDLKQRVKELEDAMKRLNFLATLRDPISLFRAFVADDMGYTSWAALAQQLQLEKWRKDRPIQRKLQGTLAANGLDTSIWDHLRIVADAAIGAFHQGSDMDPRQALHFIRTTDMPESLQHTKGSMDKAFTWLTKRAMD